MKPFLYSSCSVRFEMSRKSSIFIYFLHRPGSERVAPVHTGVNSISRVATELTAQNGPDQTTATL
ncbi:hypothetical protein BGY98DRAFT_1067063, partial [Russula aff. rugulosa BPL654]